MSLSVSGVHVARTDVASCGTYPCNRYCECHVGDLHNSHYQPLVKNRGLEVMLLSKVQWLELF